MRSLAEPAYRSASPAAVKCAIEPRRMFGKHASVDATSTIMTGRLARATVPEGAQLRILIDGEEALAHAGDSLLVAVLMSKNALRRHELSDEMRAGVCLMG